MKLKPNKQFTADQLKVNVYASRDEMGHAAAIDVADQIKYLLSSQDKVRMIFAAAPSQNEVLSYLVEDESIDWSKIEAFHMDEYIGLPSNAPQRFGNFLTDRIFHKLPEDQVHYINSANSIEEECSRYSALIEQSPIDIVCLGIGENGHLAFNDPPVADFQDPSIIKAVELDEICRQQQVNDGCFPSVAEVPTHALTLTISTLLSASSLYCVVPSETKYNAVQRTIHEEISIACPSTILRKHPNCTLYVEPASYGSLS